MNWLELVKKVNDQLYLALIECDDYASLRDAVRNIYGDIPDIEEAS